MRLIGAGSRANSAGDGARRPRAASAFGRRAWLRPLLALELIAFFLYELVIANIRIAFLVLGPEGRLRPMVVAVRVETQSDEELAVLSDLVTLTPGTLSLDVENDGQTLLVHVLGADDPQRVRREIKDGLARRVRRLFA